MFHSDSMRMIQQQTGYCQLNTSCQKVRNVEVWWAWILSRSYGSSSAVILTESLCVCVIFLQNLIWVPNNGDIFAFACCCQVKLGPSKWARMVGGSAQWHVEEMALISFSSIQVTSKRPASSPVPPIASSVSGPTGHGAASPVGVEWRFALNGCVKNHIMEGGLAPNWTMSTRYFLPLILILRILAYYLDSLCSIFFSKWRINHSPFQTRNLTRFTFRMTELMYVSC